MASPFFTDVVNVVGSFDAPHGVVSDERGSTMKVLEIRLGSASAAGVSAGAPGGAPLAPGVPQLKSPPVPVTLTAPAGQVGTGDAEPELAQSNVTPAGGVRRTLPSSASQFEGAALEGRGTSSAAVALTANASNAAHRRLEGRTVTGTLPELTHGFNPAPRPTLPQRRSEAVPHQLHASVADERQSLGVVAERARFELANRVRRLRHFQCGLPKTPPV